MSDLRRSSKFKRLNAETGWNEQIKPFTFVLVGFQAVKEGRRAIKPLSPFSKDPQSIVYLPFVDYDTGKELEGIQYFKPLSRTILDYMRHLEHKFESDEGYCVDVIVDGVVYIGKEANNIDEQSVDVKRPQLFVDPQAERERILKMTSSEAEEMGMSRGTLSKWKTKLRQK